ncbi:MAG: hypothetical protein EPN20_06980 [Magnetospirillum sp.]|nr:MAG: hypothetical protein EPN20_06980 [Magnetospirillum sp.]
MSPDGDCLLSEFSAVARMDVRRDGRFRCPGYLNSRLVGMLVPLHDPAYGAALAMDAAVAAVIASPETAPLVPAHLALAVSPAPRVAMLLVHRALADREGYYWRTFPGEVGAGTVIAAGAVVADRDVRIGRDCLIEANVTIHPRTIIGDGVTIRAGAVIGTTGFEIASLDGQPTVFPHVGGVELADRVEIQANAVVEAGVFARPTRVHSDAKVGARAVLSHSSELGARSLLASGALVCGSTVIGDDAWIGPGAVVGNSLRLGNGVVVTMGQQLTSHLADGMVAYGGKVMVKDKFAALRRLALGRP